MFTDGGFTKMDVIMWASFYASDLNYLCFLFKQVHILKNAQRPKKTFLSIYTLLEGHTEKRMRPVKASSFKAETERPVFVPHCLILNNFNYVKEF